MTKGESNNDPKPTPSNPAPQPPDELWGTFERTTGEFLPFDYLMGYGRENRRVARYECYTKSPKHIWPSSPGTEVAVNLAELYRQQGREEVLGRLKTWSGYIDMLFAANGFMDGVNTYTTDKVQKIIAEMVEQVALGNSPFGECEPEQSSKQ